MGDSDLSGYYDDPAIANIIVRQAFECREIEKRCPVQKGESEAPRIDGFWSFCREGDEWVYRKTERDEKSRYFYAVLVTSADTNYLMDPLLVREYRGPRADTPRHAIMMLLDTIAENNKALAL
jgi:hypothetical protein